MALLGHILLKGRITINLKRILPTSQDPGDLKESIKPHFSRDSRRNTNFLLNSSSRRALAVFVILALPISVSAGLIGAFSGFFSTASASNFTAKENIQNMHLLAAASSPNGKEVPDPNIIDESAIAPVDGPAGTDPSAHKPTSDQISIYVVREGDTLSQIADMFDVSVNTIKWGNNITGNTLTVGQTLTILPVTGVKYTVVKGDTLAGVAKKFKGDAGEIANFNGISTGSALAVGSIIIIPDGEIVPTSSGSSSGYVGPKSTGLKEYAGYYLRPITGGRKSQGIHGHNAVDLAAPVGTPILASADGTVIISKVGGWNGGYGNYVVIKHDNGTQTLYAHTNDNTVAVGEQVKQGQVIAHIGLTGKVTGAHVHFEIRGAKNPF